MYINGVYVTELVRVRFVARKHFPNEKVDADYISVGGSIFL